MQARIFLIGFMGSGKTTLGKRLAHRTGYTFADMDQVIEETAGMSIPAIFEEHGEEVFRKWERNILVELCTRKKIVISTGGGAPCHGDMMEIMMGKGLTVYLYLPPEVLKDRLLHAKAERPLLKGKSEEELLVYIKETLEARESYYKKAALIVEGVTPNLDALASAIEAF